MKITAQEKEATRRRILESAAELFRTQGFDAATTRDVARAAGVAAGTVFNYFDTKEAIVVELAAGALRLAHADFDGRAIEGGLAEDLFALIAAELRQLRPYRKFLQPLVERWFGPSVRGDDPGTAARRAHLEIVTGLVLKHGQGELSPVAVQLYWTLYTGALSFWSSDKSPKQEDTLALLDESLAMFVAWLASHDG